MCKRGANKFVGKHRAFRGVLLPYGNGQRAAHMGSRVYARFMLSPDGDARVANAHKRGPLIVEPLLAYCLQRRGHNEA